MRGFVASISVAVFFGLSACRKAEPEAPASGYGKPVTVGATGGGSVLGTIAKNTLNAKSPVGMTLAQFGAATSEWIAVDQMAQGTDWVHVPCTAAPAEADGASASGLGFDSQGWVNDLGNSGDCAATRLFSQARGVYPAGKYLIKYDGSGDFAVTGDASAVTSLDVGLSAFDVTTPTTGGVLLMIESLSAVSPLKNVRVYMPGGVCGKSATELDPFASCKTDRGGEGTCSAGLKCYDFADVAVNQHDSTAMTTFIKDVSAGSKAFFHPTFLASLAKYRALGFGSSWIVASPRLTLNAFYAHHDLGAPFELPIALCNLVQADPYLSLPVSTTSTAVGDLASWYGTHLNSNLTPVFDLAPEWWVSGSSARQTLDAEAASNSSTYEMTYFYHAYYAAKAWRAKSRGFMVMSMDPTDTGLVARALASPYYGFGDWQLDGFSVHDRFVVPLAAGTDSASQTAVFDALTSTTAANLNLAHTKSLVSGAVNAVRAKGKKLVSYGSGPILGNYTGATDARNTARVDTRMSTAVAKNLVNWKDAGGDLVMFDKSADDSDTTSGYAWGARADQTDTDSRIYGALSEFIDATPCWWTGCERTTSP